MKYAVLALAFLLGACSGGDGGSSNGCSNYGGYGLNCNSNQPNIFGWSQQWTQDQLSSPNFTFPNDGSAEGGVHYMLEPPPSSVTVGKTITATFTLAGTGVWGSNDSSDTVPPGTVHLYMNERGDTFTGQGPYADYRQFCGRTEITSPGTYTVSCKLDPTLWTGVFGANASAQAFSQLVSNLYAVGLTFGGASFAGHGLYVKSGSITFTLNSFTIQ